MTKIELDLRDSTDRRWIVDGLRQRSAAKPAEHCLRELDGRRGPSEIRRADPVGQGELEGGDEPLGSTRLSEVLEHERPCP